MSKAKASVIAVLAATIVAAVVLFLPHVTSRVISTGTPVPQPVTQLALFPLPQHRSICLDEVAVEPGEQVAVLGVDTPATGPPLLFTIRGSSYAQSHRIPAGYISGGLAVPFEGPHSPQLTKVCIRNLGGADLQLRGTNEARTLSRPRMTIAGARSEGEFSLAFRTANGENAFKLVGAIADRISAFKPVWVQPWSVILLITLVLVGSFAVPLLVLWRSFVLDER